MKKNLSILTLAAMLLTLASCQRENIHPIEQQPFSGHYAPFHHITQIRHDIREEGVEAGFDSLTLIDHWHWTDRLLTRVDYNAENTSNYSDPYSDYYYYSGGRLDSLTRRFEGSDRNSNRTFHFSYQQGRLSRISFLFGNTDRNYTTDFLYRTGEEYPYAIVFTHPVDRSLWNLYHTDTVVQTWTLEWSGGNLARATADSMAWYITGMSHIDYFYDNHPNPCQGWFNASLISSDGFIDDPTCFCRNNLVRRVGYNYYQQGDTTYVLENTRTLQYEFGPNGYPSAITTTTPTLYWTDIINTSHFTYAD